MVMERVDGIPVNAIGRVCVAAGIDIPKLARDGVEIFYTQVFRDGFFHADMHPGNILVARDGRYCGVDFGIMGTLSDEDRNYLATNMRAFFERDYRKAAQAHVDAGWVPKGTRVTEFEGALRSLCEPIFDKPLKEIYFGKLLMRLFEVGRRFGMQVQPQLMLLMKTILQVEGLGRQLDPNLDLRSVAQPVLERFMSEQAGISRRRSATCARRRRSGPRRCRRSRASCTACSPTTPRAGSKPRSVARGRAGAPDSRARRDRDRARRARPGVRAALGETGDRPRSHLRRPMVMCNQKSAMAPRPTLQCSVLTIAWASSRAK